MVRRESWEVTTSLIFPAVPALFYTDVNVFTYWVKVFRVKGLCFKLKLILLRAVVPSNMICTAEQSCSIDCPNTPRRIFCIFKGLAFHASNLHEYFTRLFLNVKNSFMNTWRIGIFLKHPSLVNQLFINQ